MYLCLVVKLSSKAWKHLPLVGGRRVTKKVFWQGWEEQKYRIEIAMSYFYTLVLVTWDICFMINRDAHFSENLSLWVLYFAI